MEFRLSTLPGAPTVTIAKWHKQSGAPVSAGEKLLEVYSAQFDWDIPSPVDGTLAAIRAAADTQADWNAVLAIIETATVSEGMANEPAATPTPLELPNSGRRVTPLASAIAVQHNLDITTLVGSGIAGQITKIDVLAAVQKQSITVTQQAPTEASDTLADTPVQANQPLAIPQASSFIAVDLAHVSQQRDALQPAWLRREGYGLEYLPFLLLAAAQTLRDTPLPFAEINKAGHSVKPPLKLTLLSADAHRATAQVVRNAESYNLVGIARRLQEMRCAASLLDASAATPGNLAICDRSSGGALLSTGIIPDGHSALLTIGAVHLRAVAVADQLAIHPVVHLSFTYDSRLIDDFTADQFIGRLKHQLETATLR